MTCTVESNAGIHLIPADLPSWKQRPARPLTIGGKEISRLIIEERRRLRGMNAIHIGAAQVCEADVFVSADTRQCAAARDGGLRVVAV